MYRVYGYDSFSETWINVYGFNLESLVSQLRERGITQIGVEILD